MSNKKIKQTLAIRDFVMGKLTRRESLNSMILAVEFGLSHRQAQRYMQTIIAHYKLDVVFDYKYKSFSCFNGGGK